MGLERAEKRVHKKTVGFLKEWGTLSPLRPSYKGTSSLDPINPPMNFLCTPEKRRICIKVKIVLI